MVDAFLSRPFLGNPVALVLDAVGLNTAAPQAIARWTNLSETTFVLPPTTVGADYHLRIFTPRSELPFAKHPTLGIACAVLEAGRVTPRGRRLVQECGVDLVDITVEREGEERRITLNLPPATVTPLEPTDIVELEAIFGRRVEAKIVAQLADAAGVVDLKPDFARSAEFERRIGVTGRTIFGAHADSEAAIEVHSFAPPCGVEEDPVCGSGSVAVFWRDRGLLPAGDADYVAAQGHCVGWDGHVAVKVDPAGEVSIDDACITCVDGVLAC